MILIRDIWTESGLNLIVSKHIFEECNGHLKVSTASMIDLVTYEFKYLNTGKITSDKSFINAYVD